MVRKTKLTDKDMQVLREGGSTRDTLEVRYAVLKDYSLRHRVTVEWDMNDDSKRDQMVKLTVGGNEVILDAEELMRYIRWI